MGEQYQVAFDMVTKYRGLTSTDKGDAYEEGELLLFQNMCLVKLGKLEEAVEHLKSHEEHITDKLSVKVKTAELLVLMGRFDAAKEAWLALVKSQPDNYRYHAGVQTAYLRLDATTAHSMFALKRLELPSTVLSLDDAQVATLKELYAHLVTLHKRSAANKIAMGLYRGADEIRAGLDNFMRANLRNAIPSLVQDVCALARVEDTNNAGRMMYATDAVDFMQNEVAQTALSLVDSYIASLKKTGHFDDSTAGAAQEPPTALLWSLFFKCHMHELRGELTQALEVINEAIAHTPTALDMHGKRARIQKKLGDLTSAAITMDDCRALDLQDRYLNNKTTKYLLRADEVPLAMQTIALFTKHEGDPQSTLHELQCNWYELELAESYARTKQWGLALRKFYAIRKHFADYNSDMFDFHGYCMRKVSLPRTNLLENHFNNNAAIIPVS
jgi:tetratricopeptide (TPR) repeat protein